VVDGLWVTRNQGVIHVLDEEALIAIVKVPKETGFNRALLHSNVF
jgi:hypothetical protein